IAPQLLAIDYYLHYKVKPQILFVDEVDRTTKNQIISNQELNHHKYRYVILPLSFDFNVFEKEGVILNKNTTLIVQYDGVNKAQIVEQKGAISYFI
ncbi:MAG: hypothetical protein WBM13_12975, partial [Bacteroidia bacterium]